MRRDWLRYGLWCVVFFGLLFLGQAGVNRLYVASRASFRIYPYAVASRLLALAAGGLLGLESLLRQRGRPGRWRVDLPRLVLLGLPALWLGLDFLAAWLGYVGWPHVFAQRTLVPLMPLIGAHAVMTSLVKAPAAERARPPGSGQAMAPRSAP
jgi:hypothetical protein